METVLYCTVLYCTILLAILYINNTSRVTIYNKYMASTRNKNTKANFALEGFENSHFQESCRYLGTDANHSGNGLLPSKLPGDLLSYNRVDIESDLRGITSNLMNEYIIVPRPKQLSTLSLYKQSRVIHPETLVVNKYNIYRPFQSN